MMEIKLPAITEIKHYYNGKRLHFQCSCLEQKAQSVVVLYRLKGDTQVAELKLPKGTLSLGYFWEQKNYNIYHWLTPQGEHLGTYLNIADQTRVHPQSIEWRDLIVDLLITPDHGCQVLDEDELPDNLHATTAQLIQSQKRLILEQHESLQEQVLIRSAKLLKTSGIIATARR